VLRVIEKLCQNACGLCSKVCGFGNILLLLLLLLLCLPVPIAVRSKAHTVFDCSNIGIVGISPSRGMDVFPLLSVICCTV